MMIETGSGVERGARRSRAPFPDGGDEGNPGLDSRRILVVDDYPDSADSLALLLRRTGNTVLTAYDGASALAIAKQFHPHIVLLDLGLPDISGYEVAMLLRRQVAMEKMLLIAVSARGTAEDRKRTWAAGFHYHLQKPDEIGQLDKALALCLGN
jgi:DNA-binding response OmpR family regulator